MSETLKFIHPAFGKNLAQVSTLPGVADLPLKIRGPFCQALIAEANGEHDKANEKLERAIAFELATS